MNNRKPHSFTRQQRYNLLHRFLNRLSMFNFQLPLLLWLSLFLSTGASAKTAGIYRIGFSSAMFTDVNENDAKAAIKIWGKQIAREKNVPTDPVPVILNGMGELAESLHEKRVDAVGITTMEYDQLRKTVSFFPLFVNSKSGSFSERYLILAHRKGSVKKLSDIGGRTICVYSNPRACLAPLWLDTLLIRRGLPATADFAGMILRETKIAKVVLPVFFGKVDACVVTKSGFDTMAELNPQLQNSLVVLAESPALVPTLFTFRSDFNPAYKAKLITGLRELKNSPAGRQVLTIFQSDDIDTRLPSCLDTALELIAIHRQLVQGGQAP